MYRQSGIIVSFTVLAFDYYSFAENKKEAIILKRKSLNILRIYDDNNSEILNQKTEQKRNKRTVLFNDARWPQQKYLSGGIVADHRVKEVCEKGYTGDGVTVAVVDGGLRYTHMEFAGRYDPSLSRDYVNNNLEPNKTDEHGTNCADVIAGAANNGICGVGIAYKAKIAGIQLTSSGIPEDSVLARAMFPFDGHGIDVFSCSWGPPDVGFKVQGPGPLTRRAFLNGVIKGRNGRGSLYVFSAGNGVFFGDNCAFNGFVNNIHTIGVAALDKNGKPMLSSEPCSAVMTAAFADNLETASASNDQACSSSFGQTSGAAAVVSGIIALGLQARKSLTWRAVHHLIRKSSKMDVIDKSVLPILNKAGFQATSTKMPDGGTFSSLDKKGCLYIF
ncbi:neuroendocrine convertase 1-like [Xenia sp. Carnegie-2017]|uniref:neuroendocrine convertase 1-like n=1 Tax=Xenia sp. Carnegie-2017 TaxID=2897299 RepID=UPI001F03E1FC|nr:neuroendocrine convertase 1-like [Xenia sp. Carnegie-2017]